MLDFYHQYITDMPLIGSIINHLLGLLNCLIVLLFILLWSMSIGFALLALVLAAVWRCMGVCWGAVLGLFIRCLGWLLGLDMKIAIMKVTTRCI